MQSLKDIPVVTKFQDSIFGTLQVSLYRKEYYFYAVDNRTSEMVSINVFCCFYNSKEVCMIKLSGSYLHFGALFGIKST